MNWSTLLFSQSPEPVLIKMSPDKKKKSQHSPSFPRNPLQGGRMASKGIKFYRCLYFTLFTGCMPRTRHGHSQVGTSAQAKGPCFQPMRTTSDFLGGKLPPCPLCQVISTAKLTEHTVAPLLKLGILTNGSKLMWLEGFSSNNRLEYFKTCHKPCLGHSGLDGIMSCFNHL